MNYRTRSEEETIALGHELSALLPQRGAVLLIGNLGAGKTTLVKGIAEARGAALRDDVSSPTFPLIHEYGNPARVFHIDLYRLESEQEVLSLGIDELLDRNALTLIEWGERFPALWPRDILAIRLEHGGEDERRITLAPLQSRDS
ncbi:tRNA (adenosine(37)-N6)-threonylcarbamoyltransferase complex ATPase subunit type 1 TsaE [Bryobacter aggregatus]|uniref:tRNA (adenosine(37)-N6)-threonylcarbamoyltransferase complex ATPase subunit type 1 TsaE n=1 Tax=Bryobacter aggregatus TaxID=360054 RepID=UPI0004E18A8E|nr:tRNA (adenosine(37)-N6)-threonylcarbamoyltransferase complex ATPase subunit type 1 TsaE [Bryobacter aggregatus]